MHRVVSFKAENSPYAPSDPDLCGNTVETVILKLRTPLETRGKSRWLKFTYKTAKAWKAR